MEKTKFFLFLAMSLLVTNGYSRTRADVISDADIYANYAWPIGSKNILDVKRYIVGSVTPVPGEQDGIDDRMGAINNLDGNNIIDINDISAQNRRYWPFVVGNTYPGEAYAYGEWDTTTTFKNKLDSPVYNYIAGNVSSSQLLPVGYEGFTGIDCSGFVARLLGFTSGKIEDKIGTSGLLNYTRSIMRATELKRGDILNRPKTNDVGGHVVVFIEWENKPTIARIVHAAPKSYSENRLAANVHFDRATLSGDVVNPGTIDVRYSNGYDARSPFPQFTWATPIKVNPDVDVLPVYDPLGPAMDLTIKSGSMVKVKRSSIRLVIDEGGADQVIIAYDGQGVTLDPLNADDQNIIVSYAIPASIMLPPGNHKIKVYATNTLDLEDSDELQFTVPESAPGISWTDYFNLKPIYGDIGGYAAGVENAPWLHTAGGTLKLTGSAGLKDFRIYNNDGMGSVAYEKDFIQGANTVVIGDALDTVPDKIGYYAVLTDQLDNSIPLYFHLDKTGPTLEPAAAATPNAAGDAFKFNISGVLKDAVSGVGTPVEMLDGVGGVVSGVYTGPGYPAGPPSAPFSFTDIVSDKKFVFFDRSGWIGTYDLLVDNRTSGLSVSNANYPEPAVSQAYGHSGVILRDASMQVTGVIVVGVPADLGPIHFLDQPQGMAVELWAVSVDNPSSANLPITYGFAPVASQKILTLAGANSNEGTFNIPMHRLGGIKLVTIPNTNSIRYLEDIDTDGDGVYDDTRPGTLPAGLFRLSADATANVAYTNLYGLEHFNKDVDLGPVRTAQSGNVYVEVRNVTDGGNVTIESARYTLVQPGYKMANSDTIYEIKTTATAEGPINLKIGFCGAGFTVIQRSTPTIFHCDAGMACTPVDTRLDGECTAAATVQNLSPFGVMVPIDDVTPPYTGIEFIGGNILVGVDLWVTTETYINLNSNDYTNIGDISGVATTYYLLDTTPTPECLAAPYEPGAAYGACANSRYNGSFTLNEGSHTINYLSADHWGNQGQPQSKIVFVDGTSPITTFAANGAEAQTGETVYITWTDSITLTAVDPISGGVASGVRMLQFLIDADASCEDTESDPAAPEGTCQYETYTGPFTLPAGVHSVSFRSRDNAENLEPVKRIYVDCAGDLTPPIVTLSLNEVDVSTFAAVYALTTDSITISAVDPVVDGFSSGVKDIYYLVDVATDSCQTEPDLTGPAGTCLNPLYAGPFMLEVGTHTIYYTAEDNVGNESATKSVFFEVRPPVVLVSIAVSPSFVFIEAGGTQQFTATGNFSDGSSRALGTSDGLTWSVDHSTVAVISPEGLATGVSYGLTRVRAVSGDLSADTGLFVYEPIPASFSATGSMTAARHMHTATLLTDGRVLITGGNDGGSVYLSSAELYDPVTGTYSPTGSMSTARGRVHTATLLPNGKVLVAGGDSGLASLASAELYDPVAGAFTATGSMTAARNVHTATLLANGKVLLIGGYSGLAAISSAELYDPAAGTFSAAGAMAVARQVHTATVLANGKVLVTGGYSGGAPVSSAEVYDPATGVFSATGPMNTVRAYHKSVLLNNGKVLVAGGYNGSAAVSLAELYDPGTGTFSATGSMGAGRTSGHNVTLLPNGKVLVAGGDEYGNNNALSSAEVYDPAAGTFSNTVSMNVGRIYHAAALLLPNGRMLVCGGYNGSASVASAELYNFGFGVPLVLESITVSPSRATIEAGGTQQFAATGNFSDGSSRELGSGLHWSIAPSSVAIIASDGLATGIAVGKARITVSSGSLSAEAALIVAPPQPGFIATGPMNEGRHMHTATLLPTGQVLVTGGNQGGYIYLSSAELYDPVTGAYSLTGSMSTARGRVHTATLLPNGKVLVAGGDSGLASLASAELYDPVAGAFTATGSMTAARNIHTATLLPDGRVLIAGGYNGNAAVSSADIYDPGTGTFSATGAMTAARHIHAAVLLANGRVLVAGGYSGGAPVPTAEIYDPATGAFTATGSMSRARAYPKTVLLTDGKVLVTGGYDGSAGVLIAELYDPGANSFTATGSMSASRQAGHTATLLPDGKVLLAGGDEYGNNNALPSAEVYDPADGTFSVTGSMSTGRLYHAAALMLNNGTTLVCGGYNGSDSVSSAELYNSHYSDVTPPVISVMSVTPQAINPANNHAIVVYELPEPGYVTLELLNSVAPHNRIESIYSGIFQISGVNSIQWNGKSADNMALPDGEYILRLKVTDMYGNAAAPLDRTVFIDSSSPQIQYISAKPGKFNPSAGEKTRFAFGLSEAAVLNVVVKDMNGAVVKELVMNSPAPAGALSYYWDGSDNSANVVQPGIYNVTVIAVDKANNRSEASGGNCEVLSSEYPAVTGLTETPDPFYPENSDQALSTVTFSYRLTAVSTTSTLFTVAVVISHPVLGVVKTLTVQQEQGDNYVRWDGLTDDGQPAPEGVYSERVSLTADGNTASAQGAFSLLRNNIYSAKSSVLAPVVTVQYDAQDATVTITEDPALPAAALVALQSQAQSGLVLASPIYDIAASQAFTTPPVLRFKYDPAYDGDYLALYKYSVSAGAWVPVAVSYFVDLSSNEIIVTLNPDVFLGSLFALMRTPDAVAPVTELRLSGSRYSAGEKLYIGARTEIGFHAQDTGGSGVSYTEYRVDDGAFTAYTAPFTAPAGRHVIEYRSADNAGNMESVKSITVYVDSQAPVTEALLTGTAGLNGWYISPVAGIILASDDLSGVESAYYRVVRAGELPPAATDYLLYTSSAGFIGEGSYSLYYYSVDNLGNVEAVKSTAFKIDLSTPAVAGASIPAPNPAGWNNVPVSVVFTGTDAVSGVAYCESGKIVDAEGSSRTITGYCADFAGWSSTVTLTLSIDRTAPLIVISSPEAGSYYVAARDGIIVSFAATDNLDPAPKVTALLRQVEDRGSPRGAGPAAIAVLNGQQVEPLGIDDGMWRLTVSATDFADNANLAAGGLFEVVHDVLPPRTALAVAGAKYQGEGPGLYVTGMTTFTLTSIDDLVAVLDGIGLGVKRQGIGVRAGGVELVRELSFANATPGQGESFVSTFRLDQETDGIYGLSYNSEDVLGNLEKIIISTFIVDNTAPVTSFNISEPLYVSDGVRYITPASVLTFTAADPVMNEVSAGVERIETAVDGGAYVEYVAALKFAEGRHTVKYRAIDNVGNTEAEHTLEVRSDATPPVSAWRVSSGENVELAGKFYLNALGKLALDSADPVIADVASGVEGIYYGVDTDPAGRYTGPFGFSEGIRTVKFNAKDNVGNPEVIRAAVIYVDGTKPASGLSVSGGQYNGDKQYIGPRADVIITAADPAVNSVASGVRETKYSVDGGVFDNYSVFRLPVEGKRVVAFYSADQVANIEAVKASELWVDATVPLTALSISGVRYDAGGLIYITKDSGIVLTAVDPVSSETASGVLITKYRVDGGDWQAYQESFAIADEGLHTVEYYSLDRVQNAEQLKTAGIAVDNTPPVATLTLGEPKFEAFGLSVITPDTPITLIAGDPVVKEAASGLKSIYYEIIPAGGGRPATSHNYLEPFKLPQGTYNIRYWSADNVNNTEPYKELRLAVSTLQKDALDAVDGLELSGNADISGAVRSNAVVSLNGNVSVLGDVTASTITVLGKARITGQRTSGATPLLREPIFLADIVSAASNTNNNNLVAAKYLVNGKLVVSAQAELTLSTGTYYFKGMELSGGCNIAMNGKVNILTDGEVLVSGGSSLNAAGPASALNIFANTASTLTFTGGGNLTAYVYAPYSHMKLSGKALLGGHYFVRTAAASGTGNILQSGESLPEAAAPAGGGPKTKAAAMPVSGFGVLAGPDPEFKLGEIYVFPNPAKGGEAPVFHIETGIADSVKITIYTVSGRAAHEYTLTGLPAELDDGNGLSYAYEYVWRGHIPSGVYLYYIEAQKAGQKLKKTGKFAVVR